MATPKFKIIDFSDQVRKNAETSLDTFKGWSDSYAERQENDINQSRKLMSDLDAVISEVDDMHKNMMSERIQDQKSALAKNIYKKKGKNGVRLNLQDLNSNDFNYARDMRSLKNKATNSRLAKELLDEMKSKMPNDKWFTSENDRVQATAAVVKILSSEDSLDSSPDALRKLAADEYRKYRDNTGEAVDIYLKKQQQTSSTTLREDDKGNLFSDTTEFYESITNVDEISGEITFNEDEINRVAESYVESGNINEMQKEAFINELKGRATNVSKQRLAARAGQLKSERLRQKLIESQIERDKKSDDQDAKVTIAEKEEQEKLTSISGTIAAGMGEADLQLISLTAGLKVGKYLDSAEEFIKHMVYRDRGKAPLDKKGVPLWGEGEAVTYEELEKNKFGDSALLKSMDPSYDANENSYSNSEQKKTNKKHRDIKEYYTKIWKESIGKGDSNQRMILFDYEGSGRSYDLADATNAEHIEQVLRSLTSTAQKGINSNPRQGAIPYNNVMKPLGTDTVEKGILDPPD